jgi:hypothetical protein
MRQQASLGHWLQLQAFTTVVGNQQPILAQVPTFIEQATMSAAPRIKPIG